MANKKIPITRISKFFGSEDFDLEQNMGMEWLHGDMHFTLVLFRVDSKLSDVDDVYGEAGPEERASRPRARGGLPGLQPGGPRAHPRRLLRA